MATDNDVGPVDLLRHGEMRLLTHLRRPILLVRARDGAYHALHPLCPHQGVNLSTGRLSGRFLPSKVGEYKYDDCAEIVRCPRHGYEFDALTGESCFKSNYRLKRFAIRIVGDRVIVEL